MGAIVAPAVIGLVANGAGIYTGMFTLLIFAGLMIAMAVVNAAMQRKPEAFIQKKTNSVVSL